MAITFTNNSATISTSEYSLPAATSSGVPTSQTTQGKYQFFVDFANSAAGDQWQVRLYEKYDSAGTQRLVEEWILTGAQSKPMFVFPPSGTFLLGQGWDFTVKRLAGADRTVLWSIRNSVDTAIADIQARLPAALTSNGNIKADVVSILNTVLTETSGQLAAAFKQFFNIASPTSTANLITAVTTVTTYTGNTPQTGDNYARLGAPAGASLAADVASIKTDTGTTIPGRLPAALTGAGYIKADALAHGGTVQTGRDIGASVLLSSGTGTGQLDFTSGVVKANLAQILGTALTETSGQIAAAFKKFFDKATPTGTVNSLPDAVAGASGGLFIAGTNAATTVTTSLTTTFTGNLTGSVGSVTGAVGSVTGAVGSVTGNVGGNVTGSVGSVASGGITAASIAADAITAAKIADGAIDAATFAAGAINAAAIATDAITAAKIATDAIGASELAADAVTEIQTGLATSAALATAQTSLNTIAGYVDTEVASILAAVDTEVAAIKAVTDALPNAGALTAIQSDLDDIQTRLPAALVSGRMDASVGAMATDTLTSGALAASAVTEIQSGLALASGVTVTTNNDKTGYGLSAAAVQAIWDALTSALTTVGSIGKLLVTDIDAAISSRSSHSAADIWAVATRLLTAGTNIVLAKGTGVTGFTDLSQADVRTATGLASANLDTQLSTIAGYIDTEVAATLAAVDTEVAAIKAKTDNLPAAPAATGDVPTTTQIVTALMARALTSGKTFGEYMEDIWAAVAGDETTDSGTSPTTLTQKDPAGVTHATYTLTGTTKTLQ